MDKLSTLLARCGLHPDALSISTMAQQNVAQMRIGLYGGRSSLPMRPTELCPTGPVPQNEMVAVATCNEREIHTASLLFSADGPQITSGDTFPLPGAEYPAPISDLIFAAAELLEPLLESCCHAALALPFPLEYASTGEVYLVRPPAELRFSDWEGLDLHATLTQELSSRGFSGTVRLLGCVSAAHLGAVSSYPAKRYLSLYWDESFTSGFALPKTAILKVKSGETSLRLLDCGSGSLQAVPFGTVDLTMDRDSLYPGEHLMDKMLSTRYLGEQYRFSMIKAAEDSLLSFMCGREFLSLRKLSLASLLQFLQEPEGSNVLAEFCKHDPKDKEIALAVGEAVLTRAIHLILANLLALLQVSGAGRDPNSPVCVALGGDAFAQTAIYTRFASLLQTELTEKRGYFLSPYYTPDLILQGAGAAALLNP